MHLYPISSALNTCAQQLESLYQSKAEAASIAALLLQKVTGLSRSAFLAHPKMTLDHASYTALMQMLHEHVVLEKPLAYILGQVPFLDLQIQICPPILIPRPETEAWCADLIDRLGRIALPQDLRILDLCTGSGCIALALAKAFPQSHIVGVDIAPEALDLARENMSANTIQNISWIQSDLFTNIPKGTFDLIVANPPYIAETAELPKSVRAWEDPRALFASVSGTALIRSIIEQAPNWLSSRLNNQIPRLWIEIGSDQAHLAQIVSALTLYTQKDAFNQTRLLLGT